MTTKKIFLTFSDSRMFKSADRLEKQAQSLNIYDRILITNETNLNSSFREHFDSKLVLGSRGYGYWCWKPQIILQTLSEIDDDDILQYTDTGCHLNERGINRLHAYFEMTLKEDSGLLGFQFKNPEPPLDFDARLFPVWNDSMWTKGDLLDYFNVRENYSIVNTPMIAATVIFIRKCPKSIKLIQSWLDTFSSNFELLDDTPSKSRNINGFVEHRHDQSIFSILAKLNGIKTVSAWEFDSPSPTSADWSLLELFPIHAKREHKLSIITRAKRYFRLLWRRCRHAR